MTDTKPENPPAFPRPAYVGSHEPNTPYPHHEQEGMTLRDYFAEAVDVSVYSPLEAFERAYKRKPKIRGLAEYITQIRYIEADAMLRARAA